MALNWENRNKVWKMSGKSEFFLPWVWPVVLYFRLGNSIPFCPSKFHNYVDCHHRQNLSWDPLQFRYWSLRRPCAHQSLEKIYLWNFDFSRLKLLHFISGIINKNFDIEFSRQNNNLKIRQGKKIFEFSRKKFEKKFWFGIQH